MDYIPWRGCVCCCVMGRWTQCDRNSVYLAWPFLLLLSASWSVASRQIVPGEQVVSASPCGCHPPQRRSPPRPVVRCLLSGPTTSGQCGQVTSVRRGLLLSLSFHLCPAVCLSVSLSPPPLAVCISTPPSPLPLPPTDTRTILGKTVVLARRQIRDLTD